MSARCTVQGRTFLVSDSNDFAEATATVTDGAGNGNGSSGRRRSTGLAGMLLPELKQLAGELGISGTGQMRKSQLIAAIQALQSGTEQSAGNGAAPAAEPRERATRATRERTATAARDAAEPATPERSDAEASTRR